MAAPSAEFALTAIRVFRGGPDEWYVKEEHSAAGAVVTIARVLKVLNTLGAGFRRIDASERALGSVEPSPRG
jgi:hypothetical protein